MAEEEIHFIRSTSPPVVWCGDKGFTSASSERGNVTCEYCLGEVLVLKDPKKLPLAREHFVIGADVKIRRSPVPLNNPPNLESPHEHFTFPGYYPLEPAV